MYSNDFYTAQHLCSMCSPFVDWKKHEIPGTDVISGIGDDYKSWDHNNPIFIDAPTGSHKTSFAYNKLVPYAISKGKRLLLVSNRIALNFQQKREIISVVRTYAPDSLKDLPEGYTPSDIEKRSTFGPVSLVTYQSLYRLLNSDDLSFSEKDPWYQNLAYVVFDEIHFLYSDALFNKTCAFLHRRLPILFAGQVRIYMTATSWEVKDLIMEAEQGISNYAANAMLSSSEAKFICRTYPRDSIVDRYLMTVASQQNRMPADSNPPISHSPQNRRTFHLYHMDADYTPYQLHFFSKESLRTYGSYDPVFEDVRKLDVRALITQMKDTPSQSNKWLVFVDKVETGKALKQALKCKNITAAFLYAKQSRNSKVWKELVTQQRFSEDVLITTSVLENGINIVDPAVKHIVIFSVDRTTFIQELGRKRLAPGARVNLWVWLPDLKQFQNMLRQKAWAINKACQLSSGKAQRISLAGRSMWMHRQQVSYDALFDYTYTGFQVNDFAARILERRRRFIEPFAKQYFPKLFQEEVASWLRKEALTSEPNKNDDSLEVLLKQNENKKMSNSEFESIREAIISQILIRRLGYLEPKRREKAGAKVLNGFLQKLEIPYKVCGRTCSKEKLWTILPLKEEIAPASDSTQGSNSVIESQPSP